MPKGKGRPRISVTTTTPQERAGVWTLSVAAQALLTPIPEPENPEVVYDADRVLYGPGDPQIPVNPAPPDPLSGAGSWLADLNAQNSYRRTSAVRSEFSWNHANVGTEQGLHWPDTLAFRRALHSARAGGSAILAAAAAAFAYDSDAGRTNAFKEAIDADAVTAVTMSGNVPSGIKIRDGRTTIYAIAGTTTDAQVNEMCVGSRDAWCLIGEDGKIVVDYTGRKGLNGLAFAPYSTRRSFYYFGVYLKPFILYALPWIEEIIGEIVTRANDDDGAVYICGHDIGGAICEVVSNYLSYATSPWTILSRRGRMTPELEAQIKKSFAGGWTFGQPYTSGWDYPWIWRDPHYAGSLVWGSYVDPNNTGYQNRPRDTALTSGLRQHLWHGDPMTVLPYNSDAIFGLYPHYASTIKYVRSGDQRESLVVGIPGDEGRQQINLASQPAIRLDFAVRHGVKRYYDRIVAGTFARRYDGDGSVIDPLTDLVHGLDDTYGTKYIFGRRAI